MWLLFIIAGLADFYYSTNMSDGKKDVPLTLTEETEVKVEQVPKETSQSPASVSFLFLLCIFHKKTVLSIKVFAKPACVGHF